VFVIFAVVYALARAHFAQDGIAAYTPEILDGRITVEGSVISDPEIRRTRYGEKTVFYLQTSSAAARAVRAKVRCRIYRREDLRYGDRVRFTAKLQRPHDFSTRFSYREYLRRRGVYWIANIRKADSVEVTRKSRHPFAFVFDLRRRCARIFAKYLPSGEAGIMQAMTLGIRANLPGNVKTVFERAGTSHILAISGLHVGIVAALVWIFLKLFSLGYRPTLAVTILFLLFYMVFTGLRPSVVRATVMGVVVLTGFLLEREAVSARSLLFAGGILFLINPLTVFDTGFQLSFASGGAIMLFYPTLWKRMEGDPRLAHPAPKYLAQSALISGAAWAGAAGLIAYHFGMITPVSLLANLAAVPAAGVIVGLGFLLLLVSWWGWAAGLTALTLKFVLNITAAVIYSISAIPGAYVKMTDVPLLAVILCYLVLLGTGMVINICTDNVK